MAQTGPRDLAPGEVTVYAFPERDLSQVKLLHRRMEGPHGAQWGEYELVRYGVGGQRVRLASLTARQALDLAGCIIHDVVKHGA